MGHPVLTLIIIYLGSIRAHKKTKPNINVAVLLSNQVELI